MRLAKGPHGELREFRPPRIMGCYVTSFVPHNASKSITRSTLTRRGTARLLRKDRVGIRVSSRPCASQRLRWDSGQQKPVTGSSLTFDQAAARKTLRCLFFNLFLFRALRPQDSGLSVQDFGCEVVSGGDALLELSSGWGGGLDRK